MHWCPSLISAKNDKYKTDSKAGTLSSLHPSHTINEALGSHQLFELVPVLIKLKTVTIKLKLQYNFSQDSWNLCLEKNIKHQRRCKQKPVRIFLRDKKDVV
jgi:hypothetical protein